MTCKVDRRNWTRLDKLFPVLIESPLFGYMNCIARNISAGGIFLETRDPLPLGSNLRIYFSFPGGPEKGFSLFGQVKNHYYLNYSTVEGPSKMTGMGVRFMESAEEEADDLGDSFGGMLGNYSKENLH